MWIWMIRAIAGSILGNATAEWFKKTKLGVWFYNKVDSIYKWAAHKYDVKILTEEEKKICLLYTSPSPRDRTRSRMPSSA